MDGSKKINLKEFDPGGDGGMTKEEAVARTTVLGEKMEQLEELLYAAQETAVLIVLQGMDTAGKDGTIQHVMGHMNPQSCQVATFKVPTPVELAHDFLWRIHAEAPGKGKVMIFNRSHYEDVLVVRVHKLVPEQEWRKRYDQINHFERLLADSETVILKFFLQISKDEQKERLLAREKDPTKSWKLSAQDWKERELWDDYQEAYEDAINRCAAPHAPWYIVPANHKWFRNIAIAEAIVETLKPFQDSWMRRLKDIGTKELAELRAMRQQHG
jgi:PPK2 family polyphosphate:nucleotide phosphotransferase